MMSQTVGSDDLVEIERQVAKLQERRRKFNNRAWWGGGSLLLGVVLVLVYVFALGSSGFSTPLSLGVLLAVAGGINLVIFIIGPGRLDRRIDELESRADELELEASTGVAESMKSNESATKNCPWCAETIQFNAIVCRFCGRDLRSVVSESRAATREQAQMMMRNPSNPQNGLGIAALVLGIIGLVLPIPFVPSIAASIMGIFADQRVRNGRATNKGVSVAGSLLGVLGIFVWGVILFAALIAKG